LAILRRFWSRHFWRSQTISSEKSFTTTVVPMYIAIFLKVIVISDCSHVCSGLPDFSWYNIQNGEKCTTRPQNIPTDHEIYQMAKKLTPKYSAQRPSKIKIFGIFGMKICKPSGNPVSDL
jgi:hypothetical protein